MEVMVKGVPAATPDATTLQYLLSVSYMHVRVPGRIE